jgi:hypothetical protein
MWKRHFVSFISHTDDFVFPYEQFRINLDTPPGSPIYTEGAGEVSAWRSVGRTTGETAPARAPITASRWPVNVQANCDQGMLARRVAGRSGGRSRHNERRSSNYRASRLRRLVGRFCQALAPNAQHRGSLRRSGDARLETKKPRAPRRIWSDRHRLPNQPRYRSAPPCRIARYPRRHPGHRLGRRRDGLLGSVGQRCQGNRIVVERSGPVRIVGARR